MAIDGFVLDSVILIDHLNGHPQATQFLAANSGGAQITAITFAEILAGFDVGPSRDAALALLNHYPLIVVDRALADRAAGLRRVHRWKLPDAIQAAAALALGIRLATRNTKDFLAGSYPWVHIPYQLA